MATVTIKVNQNELAARLQGYKQEVIVKARNRTLNRTAGRIKGFVAEDMHNQFGMQKSKLKRDHLAIKKALRRGSIFIIALFGQFPVIGLGRATQTATGTTVRGVRYDSAFIQRMPRSGKRGVFQRKGTLRKRVPPDYNALPIEEVKVDMSHAAPRALRSALRFNARTFFRRTFRQHLKFFNNRRKARRARA